MADDNQIIGATVKLDTSDASGNVQDLKKDINEVKDSLKQVDGAVKLDTSAATQSIQTLKDNISGIDAFEVPIDVQTESAADSIEVLKTKLADIRTTPIGVDLDTSDATSDIENVKQEISSLSSATVQVDADIAPATTEIDKLKNDLGDITAAPVPVIVDTDDAHAQIDGLESDLVAIESSPVQVDIDTEAATQSISGIKDELSEIGDSSAKVDVDTSDAETNIDGLKKDLQDVASVPVQVNTEIADTNIRGLKKEVGEIKTTVKDAGGVVQVSTVTAKGNVKDLKKDIADVKTDLTAPAGTVKVDTTAATAQVKELKKNLREAKVDLQNTGSAAAGAGKDISGATGHFANIKNQVASLPGPLGQAASGVTGLGNTFKALLANPVGIVLAAIVGVLTLLYKAFQNTYEGGQKLEQVFAGIKAAGQALLDNFFKIAGIIGKVFTFDFSGAIDDINEVNAAVIGAYNQMAELTKQAQALKREQLANDLDSAERAKRLAILREQATDDSIPVAKRKALLKELQADAEQNAKEDIELARRTAENKIAQLTLEKDGAKKNAEEITKIKIEQIGVETENANELRRINKQVTAAEKEEIAARKEAQQKATEAAKQERAKLIEFNNKLARLQQENDLLLLKDGYDKELQALEFKFENERRALLQDFTDKKITKEQLAQLESASDLSLQLQKKKLQDKNNEELKKKEADFQKEISQLSNKIKLDGISDARQSERLALQIGYEEKLQEAITRYKDDQVKFAQVKALIDEEQRLSQQKLDAKFKKEDDKKKFEADLEAQKAIVDSRTADFDAKRAAVDAEQVLIKKAFDDKLLTEQEFTAKSKELSDARIRINEIEAENKMKLVQAVSSALDAASAIVGRNTAVGKGLAAAASLINTYAAIAGQLRAFAGVPIPGYAILQALATAAVGFKAVKDIVSVKVPGGTSGPSVSAPASPSVTQAAPIAPVQASTKINEGQVQSITSSNQSKTYVLSGDVASARERDERLRRASILGGG